MGGWKSSSPLHSLGWHYIVDLSGVQEAVLHMDLALLLYEFKSALNP